MAVDKGWSWVVLFASFMDLVLCGIFVYTVGVFHVVLLDVFQEDATKTALVGAVRSSLMALTAPLASLVINTFNCRICAISGGLFIFLGSGLSALVNNTDQLLLTYGFICGLIVNRTQTYDSAFIFAGAVLLMASTMTLITAMFHRKHVQNISGNIFGSFSVIPQENAVRSQDISLGLCDYMKVRNSEEDCIEAHAIEHVLPNEKESNTVLTCMLLSKDNNSQKNNTRETKI